MQQTVYGDLFFLINFSMDFLCLFLVAKLLSKPMSTLRFSLASAVGGIYSVTALFLPGGITSIFLDILCCVLICFFAFPIRGNTWRSFVILLLSYVLASVLLGGMMTAVFSLLNRLSPPLAEFEETADIPPWILISVGILSGLGALYGGKFLHRSTQTKHVHLNIRLCGKSISCTAFCDSGNLLADPLDGRKVILIDNSLARSLLPTGISESDLLLGSNVIPPSLVTHIRVIPIKTANAESILCALRPDKIILKTTKHTCTTDALIGFADLGGAPSECKALIPPELIL